MIINDNITGGEYQMKIELPIRGKSIRILSIRKRNFLVRFLSINHWKVTISYNNRIREVNCWAGCYGLGPYLDSLIWSLFGKLRLMDEWFSKADKRITEAIKKCKKNKKQ